MMKHQLVVLVSVLALIGAALAQTQQRSIRADVQQLKEFVAWKALGPVVPNAALKLARSQVYNVTLRLAEGQTPTVSLLLGTGKKSHVHFAGIIFNGEANHAAGVAHGYLTAMVAERCLGLDNAALSKIKLMTRDVVNRLKGPRVGDTVDIGTIHAEASAEQKDGNATIVVTMDRRDTPGQNGWRSYCGLEPE
jgi:hypothetical protein